MTNNRHIPKRRFKEFESDSDWEETKLRELFQYIGNAFVGTATPYYVESGHFYLESNNIKDGQINHNTEVFINDEFYQKQKNKWLQTGDIVMVQSGHVGHAAVIPENLNNSAAHALIMFRNPSENLESHFLNYQYQTTKAKKKIKTITTGNTIQHILASDMKEYKVYVSNLEEQKRIGNFFQTIDSLITLHQHKLDKLKNLKKSYLAELFPAEGERVPKRRFPGFEGEWKEKKLGEVVEKFDNLRIPVASKDRIAGNIPYYGANGIQDYVEGFTHDGEFVLLAEDGANDLNDYPVQYVNGKIWVNNHAHVIQGKNNLIDNKFLLFAIKQIQMEPYLVGGGRAKLNAEIMMNLPLTAPEISEQRMIGAFLMKVEKQISLQQEKLAKLKDLKKAYLNELFV
ncbi:restriction endonuclease subunit S [Streptococcus sp. 21WXBC0057M1]|jgi:hypothetical protein|uniref:Restriction endonuclease subunit S n=1 Tax=Streptococcus wuxiensis TaxID=3095078 RepID=A0ABU5FVT2_9STRE|nr:restriction endonuclease subunit S [Streptococcus sp. 21WXBC0057M1]MDY4337201.1 restriction endonuclease subunit S [Streptococcus sp. 21WXBC0057M1]